MKLARLLPRSACAVAALTLAHSALADVTVTVQLDTVRASDGVDTLDRAKFFGLCDQGSRFDERVKSEQRYAYLLDELGVTFGRRLGPIAWAIPGDASYPEDPDRPGFADLDAVRALANPTPPDPDFAQRIGGRLDVAAHGAHGGFPDFMGMKQTTATQAEDPKNHLPMNIEAAAELSAVVFEHFFTDFDRPTFYEPINEPHWTHFQNRHLAEWHLATHEAFEAAGLSTQVGGPCLSVAYFYRDDYQAFTGMRDFIDATDGQLPFYSFHAYDYITYADGAIGGRVTSGLPLQGMLDLLATYGHNEYGSAFPLMLSEHGGYVIHGHEAMTDELVGPRGDVTTEGGWAREMERRSLAAFQLVSSSIANTMTFMDHPHTVKKAVPFILLESMAWDPEYYSVLYVPRHFTDNDDWVLSENVMFYELFAGVAGKQLVAHSDDPDVQVQAFADSGATWVLLNNLADKPEPVRLDLGDGEAPTALVRRFGPTGKLTPVFDVEESADLATLTIGGRESLVLRLDRAEPPTNTVSEVPVYAEQMIVAVEPNASATFDIALPDGIDVSTLRYAELRVAVVRASGMSPAIDVQLNDAAVTVPVEDAARRYDAKGQEYAATKIVRIQPALLNTENRITVSFPDGGAGTVGTVVLRLGIDG
ncbi:MAG: beta-agarase [Planctomycetota bacterium]